MGDFFDFSGFLQGQWLQKRQNKRDLNIRPNDFHLQNKWPLRGQFSHDIRTFLY
jgi:hypothetical protein